MTATLTDRYVISVARRVPDKERSDIERELRAAIGDDIDARVDRGQAPDEAEFAALSDLGNPARLAARYVHRPVALIGPDLYPEYRQALRGVALAVLPAVYVVLAIVFRARGENVWVTLFRPLGDTVNVAVYLFVCVTVLFAAVDRAVGAKSGTAADTGWTPDRLAPVQVRRETVRRDLIGLVGKAALVIGLLLVQRWVSPVSDAAGKAVPVINPALWGGWIPWFMTLVVLAVVLRAVEVRLRRWSPVTAVIGTALTLAGAVPLAWLFWQARVLNHELPGTNGEFTTHGSWISWVGVLFAALVVVARLTDIWRGRRPADAHRP
ncbi:permease prefix domain 1-containing protein [Streptomyces sp. NBC_00963]|uniref:permease prefix domain 1-containing protein n=1 Tax=Streptomyces sp. NBC_00963 TaxID=2903697 RepID=UPI003865ABEE|nr:permease prefix domain 1-containing protein [Streptomyces sp. NBC_00963]